MPMIRLRTLGLACALGFAIFCTPGVLGDEPKAPKGPENAAPGLSAQVEAVKKEFEDKTKALNAALEKTTSSAERGKLYRDLAPDRLVYCRRMIDLALTDPKTVAARDALLWVMGQGFDGEFGHYGLEYARATGLLVQHHGDDPDAVRVGLNLNMQTSVHRDTLLLGFLAAAKSHESRGLARLALAQYLRHKADVVDAARGKIGRPKEKHAIYSENGQRPVERILPVTDEQYAYEMLLRQADPVAIRTEAERLYKSVASEYADIPHITTHDRRMEALAKASNAPPDETSPNKPQWDSWKQKSAAAPTLGSIAEECLDEWHNLTVGKRAPEITGVDLDGKPLKLSDHRGKVVLLVFWGTWSAPSISELHQVGEFVETFRGRPFALLGVNCMDAKENARNTMEDMANVWPNWFDGERREGSIADQYHIRNFPAVFLIDSAGKIQRKYGNNVNSGNNSDKGSDIHEFIYQAEAVAKAKNRTSGE